MQTDDLNLKIKRFEKRMEKTEEEKMADGNQPIDIGARVDMLEHDNLMKNWVADGANTTAFSKMYDVIGDDPSVLADKDKAQEVADKAALIYTTEAMNASDKYFGGTKHKDELGFHTTGIVGAQIANLIKQQGKNFSSESYMASVEKGKEHALMFPQQKLIEGIGQLPFDEVAKYVGLDASRVKDEVKNSPQTLYKLIKQTQGMQQIYK